MLTSWSSVIRLEACKAIRQRKSLRWPGMLKGDTHGQCLFSRIPGNSWQSNGYPYSQIPASGNWTGNLGKAKAVAESDSLAGVITTYATQQYTAVFISNFPEYFGGTDDEQLLYCACTCYTK
jgi:hypothetical protein